VPAQWTKLEYDTTKNYAREHQLIKTYISGGETYGSSSWYIHMNDTYGYINQRGEVIVPCKYLFVTDFNNSGNCTVAQATKQKGWLSSYYYQRVLFGITSASGEVVTPAKWRTLGTCTNNDWNNDRSLDMWDEDNTTINKPFAGICKVQTAEGSWGFMTEDGKILGATDWMSISSFSEGMAIVQDSNKMFTFINEQGQVVGESRWVLINDFSNGLAAVQDSNGLWGFIDKQNNLVIPCRYSEVQAFRADGTCDVYLPGTGWQVIDMNGETSFFGN